MNNVEKYSRFFTKDYMMGPNSFRLLEEMLRRNPFGECEGRVLDLGCGMALTSFYLANETPSKVVYAFDLWVDATDNLKRIRELGLEDRIIPLHGDAMEMPFARDWFDTIVSVDAYHYFGCREGIFSRSILPFVRRGGTVMIAVPGLKEEPGGELRTRFETWAEGDDSLCFHTAAWWKSLLEKECADQCDISVLEAAGTDEAWEDWFRSGHRYAVRDQEFLSGGLDKIMAFPFIYVRKK